MSFKMAMPLCSMLRPCQQFFNIVLAHTRRLSSKKQVSKRGGQVKQLNVRSLLKLEKDNVSASGKSKDKVKGKRASYAALLDERHRQAARSVLIRINQTPQGVCDYLQTFGPIHAAYSLQNGGAKDCLLVEFSQKETVDRLLQHVSYFQVASQIPVRSRLLFCKQIFPGQRRHLKSPVAPELVCPKRTTAEDYLSADDVSSQMQALHSVRQLSEVGSRIRFFVCSAVEDLVRASLPFARVNPFGSSINGFGWEGCDLDMVMTLMPPKNDANSNSPFFFLTKRSSDDERLLGQQCLDTMGEVVRSFMPSAYFVNKVLRARVPIVKFHHEAANIDCDLAYDNLSGSKMSELMYLFGEIDPRVRVLMTTIKEWAKTCELTHSNPGPWPANFTLLAMLVVFLQSRSPPVLPSVRHLQMLAGPDDHFTVDDVDCAFVTDITKVAKSINTQSLEDLLQEFFAFYASFDFTTSGLSLIEGGPFTKHIIKPMYIENPLEIAENISKNVNNVHLTKLQVAMHEAAQRLDSQSVPSRAKPWGLACLLQPPASSPTKSYNVTGLFQEEQDAVDSEEHSSEEVPETVDSWEGEVDVNAQSGENEASVPVVETSRQKNASP